MDLATWHDQVSAISPLSFALVAMAGLTIGVAPSSLPLFTVVVGFVGGRADQRESETRARGLRLSAGFVLGMATVDATIGALFGFLGVAVIRVLSEYLVITNFFIAALLVILGLALLRKIRIWFPVLRPAMRRVDSFAGAYTLGIPFGLVTCPACTPMMMPILAAAAASGSPWMGAALLFVSGLARGFPLLLAGTAAGMVKRVRRLAVWVPRIERACGILLLIAALYFVYQGVAYMGFVPAFQFLFR